MKLRAGIHLLPVAACLIMSGSTLVLTAATAQQAASQQAATGSRCMPARSFIDAPRPQRTID